MVLLLTILASAVASANAFAIRAADGSWVSPGWESWKRSGKGEVVKIPLTNAGNKAYTVAIVHVIHFSS